MTNADSLVSRNSSRKQLPCTPVSAQSRAHCRKSVYLMRTHLAERRSR